jgi:hypothetical protein
MALTIDQLAAMENVTHPRTIPADISALLNASYYSESRQEQIRIGDLTLPHFIRVMRKASAPSVSQTG